MIHVLQAAGYFAIVYGLAWYFGRRDHETPAPEVTLDQSGEVHDNRDPVESFLHPLP